MIVSQTYMGEHLVRQAEQEPNRKMIVRAVPADRFRRTVAGCPAGSPRQPDHCSRNTRRTYLLRGLIKCGLCGLTFSGITIKAPRRTTTTAATGASRPAGYMGSPARSVPAKSLNGDYVERLVWADIESFLRNPGEILERLRERVSMQDGERQRRQKELDDLTDRLQQKAGERDRVLGLFRRGRIDDATLDQQLDQINTEAFRLHAEIEAATRALAAGDRTAQLRSAEELLATLRKRLDGPVPAELKRRIVEILVEKIEANTVERWGVQQSEIIITYRFSQPNEPAALVLPRSHRLANRNRPPEQLNTLGDHLLRRRLTLKLLQRQVAEQLGVDKTSIYNWETNRTKPGLEYMPAIIRFLGYNPLPPADGWPDRLVRCRTVLGISQKESARRIGVDASTLARWERGEREPTGAFATRVLRFLGTTEGTSSLVGARTA